MGRVPKGCENIGIKRLGCHEVASFVQATEKQQILTFKKLDTTCLTFLIENGLK